MEKDQKNERVFVTDENRPLKLHRGYYVRMTSKETSNEQKKDGYESDGHCVRRQF